VFKRIRTKMDPNLSPCHQAEIWGSLGDGVFIGSCSECFKDVKRLNPRTGVEEWLDGESPWSAKNLRPVHSKRFSWLRRFAPAFA